MLYQRANATVDVALMMRSTHQIGVFILVNIQ